MSYGRRIAMTVRAAAGLPAEGDAAGILPILPVSAIRLVLVYLVVNVHRFVAFANPHEWHGLSSTTARPGFLVNSWSSAPARRNRHALRQRLRSLLLAVDRVQLSKHMCGTRVSIRMSALLSVPGQQSKPRCSREAKTFHSVWLCPQLQLSRSHQTTVLDWFADACRCQPSGCI